MGDTKDKALTGIEAYIDTGEKGFSKIEVLLDATGGLSLSQVCSVTGLEGTTIQNWVKRGWVAHPKGKKYEEVHIARILIINALKECIKLEHISMLMTYVNGSVQDSKGVAIKESELYSYLCDALRQSGRSDDHSRNGVESVVDSVIRNYRSTRPGARVRIRKALTLMIFACVCTDVKRRTEAMMGQILHELEHPETVVTPAEAQVVRAIENSYPEELMEEIEAVTETKKTVSQALREWDISSVERIIIDHDEEARNRTAASETDEKAPAKPWYVRKNPK